MKKNSISTIVLVLVFLVGLSLMLYPSVADYWNSFHSSQVLYSYTQEISNLDNESYDAIFQEARAYNQALLEKSNVFHITEEDKKTYAAQLDFAYNGVMGYVEIPLIDVSLPIYHGTDEAILQTGIGHIEWSSLPVGGIGSHSVISGHRGLPSAKLFTNLDKLKEGDTFTIRVLDEVMVYMVDQILIVLPDEVDNLAIDPGRDLCTLVTCTPYGINSHRLLVRGTRIEGPTETVQIRVTADAIQIEPLLMAPLVAAPMLLVLLVWLMIPNRRKRR